ncbi:MAG: peptidylprolyl isomerase [Chthoniobacterales bacterium]|nr:peptidylprolyl isomerase [Chthoniobacterales bacterium]
MNRICFFVYAFVAADLVTVLGQNQAPLVVSPIAGFTAFAGAPGRSIDLAAAFKDADASTAVEFSTVLGNVGVVLYGQQKPITVANFLNYVNSGRYFRPDPTTQQLASSFIHRSIPGFVIQGGGFLGTADPGQSARHTSHDVSGDPKRTRDFEQTGHDRDGESGEQSEQRDQSVVHQPGGQFAHD